MMYRHWTYALGMVTALAFAGCGEGDEGSPTMRPGEACLSCHGSGEERLTAAGTAFTGASSTTPLVGGTVSITDDAGKQVSLTTNSAGNFYTSESLTFPITLVVSDGTRDATMVSGASSGDCNGCHSASGSAMARIYVP